MRLIAPILVLVAAASAQERKAPPVPIWGQDKEVALGRALREDQRKQYRPLEDPAAVARVNSLAAGIEKGAGLPFPVSVSLADSAEAVGSAFPGGFLLLSSGLLRRTTDAELAGVLAHEIAHIALEHDAQPAVAGSRQRPGRFLSSQGGLCWRFDGDAPLAPIAWQQPARESEEKADALAREYLAKAGLESPRLPELFSALRKAPAPVNRPTLRRTGERK